MVGRAHSAWEAKLPVLKCQKQREGILSAEYRSLLQAGDIHLPDPMYELQNWIGEDEGLRKWPHTRIVDLSAFIGKLGTDIKTTSLRERILSDYKEQKAYSFFSSRWLFQINYHPISDQSPYCFMMTKCKPSLNVHDEPHDVWVCIKKDTGRIHSAYCTCFAG